MYIYVYIQYKQIYYQTWGLHDFAEGLKPLPPGHSAGHGTLGPSCHAACDSSPGRHGSCGYRSFSTWMISCGYIHVWLYYHVYIYIYVYRYMYIHRYIHMIDDRHVHRIFIKRPRSMFFFHDLKAWHFLIKQGKWWFHHTLAGSGLHKTWCRVLTDWVLVKGGSL